MSEPIKNNESSPDTSRNLNDIWNNSPFGSLTDTPTTFSPNRKADLPKLTSHSGVTDKSESGNIDNTRKVEKKNWRQLDKERKEAIKKAEFDVSFNRSAIANLLKDNPDFLPRNRRASRPEERELELKQREDDLQRTLNAIISLPEQMRFNPGITLIVGENGIGKSTLARALQLSAKIQDDVDFGINYHDYEKSAERILDPKNSQAYEPALTGLAPHIARHIKVNKLATCGKSMYYDTSLLMGSHNLISHDVIHQEHTATDLTHGKSHRQRIDWGLFGHLQSEKDDKFEMWSGPQVYFIDEPEVGMSPRRHRKLIEQLLNSTAEESILIIPTNSMVLYDSDLPRIDLEHPERGIFKPSDFPEDIN